MLSHSDILLEVHNTILIDIWTMNALSKQNDSKTMSILVSKQNCGKIFKTVSKYVIFLVKEETKSYFLIDI